MAAAGNVAAAESENPKPAIRGLVSMGAFKYVGSGGDPVHALMKQLGPEIVFQTAQETPPD